MTSPARRLTLTPAKVLGALAVVAVAVAIFTPESTGKRQGGRSSFSAGSDGVRMMFELAQRMGWRADRRVVPLDSVGRLAPTVQVVLAPRQALGAHEVHRLLTNVRQGGGLIFALDDGGEIADSLGLATGRPARFLADYGDSTCAPARAFTATSLLAIPPEVHQIRWRRTAPGPTVSLVTTHPRMETAMVIGVGFPMGAGRVAVVSSSEIFANDVLRQCRWGADIAAARVLEYVRPPNVVHPSLVFDEYHHGFGMHGGSVSAVAGYLSHSPSGRFLAQALVAGLLLVLAKAPRPIIPHDPERVVRRSPLEHADALGQAYADVAATRTATARLVSGLRRRSGRVVPGGTRLDDAAFLDSVASRWPAARSSVSIVDRALREPLPPRELAAVGDAVRDIERHLTAPPPATIRS